MNLVIMHTIFYLILGKDVKEKSNTSVRRPERKAIEARDVQAEFNRELRISKYLILYAILYIFWYRSNGESS